MVAFLRFACFYLALILSRFMTINLFVHCEKTSNSPNVETLTASKVTSKFDLDEILDVTSSTPVDSSANNQNDLDNTSTAASVTTQVGAAKASDVAQSRKTRTVIKIAAIDNGLAFPCKHPDEWRACKLN